MKRALYVLASIVFMVILVLLVFRDTNWGDVGSSLRQVDWVWLLLAQVSIWAALFVRAERWACIIRTTHPVRFRHVFSAGQIGALINFTINLRLGEFVRGLVLARLTRLSFSKAMALATLDRVTDLLGLSVVLFIAAASFQPPAALPAGTLGADNPIAIPESLFRAGAQGTVAVSLAVVTVLVLLYVNQGIVLRVTRRIIGTVSRKLADKICTWLEQFAEGLHTFRSGREMAKAVLLSLATWGLFTLGWAAFLNAFGLSWPWYTVFVLEAMLALATVLPGTPGMIGQYHLPIVLGILMCVTGSPNGIEADAKAVAILGHLCHLLPVGVLGIACLYMEGLGFAQLAREGSRAKDADSSGASEEAY